MRIVATNGATLVIQTADGWDLHKGGKVTNSINKEERPNWLVSAVTGKGYVRIPDLEYPAEELTRDLANELYERYSK